MLNFKKPSTTDTMEHQFSKAALRTELEIKRYLPMIKAMARSYFKHRPASLELDDLVSVGTFGLLEAMARFDVSRGVSFEAYAKYRIRGAILDEIRRMSWVSRGTFERIGLVNKTEQKLGQQYGQYPTDQQVANHLGKSTAWVDGVKQHKEKINIQGLSDLSEVLDGGAKYWSSAGHTPLELYEQKEQARITREALHTLPTSESNVLLQYYFEEVPMKMIGEKLGVTESRISQIHSSAVAQLRVHHWNSSLRMK